MGNRTVSCCAACGKAGKQQDMYMCRDCAKTLCGTHAVQYVDAANESITRNSPILCQSCYRKRYPNA